MLAKINRIKDKRKFPAILNRGNKFFCPFFLLIVESPFPHQNKASAQSRSFAENKVSDQDEVSAQNLVSAQDKVSLQTIQNEPLDSYIEFGFITSKKVGGAVERNHVRRILSEIIRKEIPLIKPNTRAIMIAHQRSANLGSPELQAEVKKIFTKARLYR